MAQTHLMTKKRLSVDVCVPAGCPVCTDGSRGYVNTSACLGHCVSSFFSPRTCFHSASADDLGSSLLNFVFWLHNLLDQFFLRCSFVVCIGLVLSDQSFWVPCVVLISCFTDLLCVELRIVSTVTFQNLTRPCGRSQWTALMPSGTLLCRTHSKFDVPMFRA